MVHCIESCQMLANPRYHAEVPFQNSLTQQRQKHSCHFGRQRKNAVLLDPSFLLSHVGPSPLNRDPVQQEVCCCWSCQVTRLTPENAQESDLKSHQQGTHMACQLLPAYPVCSLCLQA